MVKITSLDLLDAADIDGTETLPVVKFGQSKRASLSDLAAPMVETATAARDAAQTILDNTQADTALLSGKLYTVVADGQVQIYKKNSASSSSLTGVIPTATYADRLKPKVLVPTIDLGAVGDGASAAADQDGMDAAINAMIASRSNAPLGIFGPLEYQNGIVLEPGIYDAGDFTIDNGSLRISARIPWTVVIRIPDGKYFCTQTGTPYSLVCDGIMFLGGKGVYKNTRTGSNVQNLVQFTRCMMYRYTECGISNNSSDSPFLKVKDCFLGGMTGYSTIGIAWGGLCDQVMVCDTSFGPNTYHIVVGNRVGGNVNILRNDFIGLGSQIETKADIWFAPDTSGGSLGNSGYAITVGWNKFGNEGQIAGNPRILVATYDGVTGTDRATYRPGTADTGRLCGVNFVGNKVISIANPNAPFIKSYVSELINWSARDNQFTGGTYTDFIQFPNGKTTSMLSASSDFEFTQAAGGVPDRFCTAQIGTLRDYAGFWPGDINRMPVHPFIDDPMITPIVSWPSANLFTYLSGSSAIAVADPYGLSEYASIIGGMSAGFVDPYGGAGGPAVLEISLAQAASRSLTHVVIDLFNYANSALGFQRRVLLPASGNTTKGTYHILIPPHASPSTWQVRVYGYNVASGTADTFVSGELYLYKGRGKLGRAKMLDRWTAAPRNRALIGGAAGTLPTGWSLGTVAGGLTTTINRVGEDQYGTFAEIAIAGTTTNGNGWTVYLEAARALGFVASAQWLYQVGVRVMAGDFTGATVSTGYDGSTGPFVLQAACYNSADTWLLQRGIAFTPDATFRLFGRTFSASYFNGGADYVRPCVGMAIPNATAVNVTLRIYVQPIIRLQ